MKTIALTRPGTDDAGGYHDTGAVLTVPDQVNADRAAELVADGRAIDPDKALLSDAGNEAATKAAADEAAAKAAADEAAAKAAADEAAAKAAADEAAAQAAGGADLAALPPEGEGGAADDGASAPAKAKGRG